MALCTADTVDALRARVQKSLALLRTFDWLLDAYVLNFFVEDHWSRLPVSWRTTLAQMPPPVLAAWLRGQPVTSTVLPLAMAALPVALKHLALDRTAIRDPGEIERFLLRQGPGVDEDQSEQPEEAWTSFTDEFDRNCLHHRGLQHIFRKHVKPKKQHEIARMATLARSLHRATRDDVDDDDDQDDRRRPRIIDIGSGVGHLSRLLAYRHRFDVTCVDIEADFTASARRFDDDLARSVGKKQRPADAPALPPGPRHLTYRLDPGMDIADLESRLCQTFQAGGVDDLTFGVVGLHTCGDLGPLLVRLFAQSSRATSLQSVGCCYMKLASQFPLSDFLRQQAWTELSYTARELSCHAIETYCRRLCDGDDDKLKVHCYRALLEHLIAGKDPSLGCSSLKTVSKAHELPFRTYALRATSQLGLDWAEEDLASELVKERLDNWWQVVAFYSLRLMFAPVIESVLLLDRCLYLYEEGIQSGLFPIFDPEVSPRNLALVAIKR